LPGPRESAAFTPGRTSITPEYIFTTIGFDEVRLDVSSLIYLSEGKISMECYYQFMNYLSALLKRESSAYKCAQAARIFIG